MNPTFLEIVALCRSLESHPIRGRKPFAVAAQVDADGLLELTAMFLRDGGSTEALIRELEIDSSGDECSVLVKTWPVDPSSLNWRFKDELSSQV